MVLETREWPWSFFWDGLQRQVALPTTPFLPRQAQPQKPFLRLLRKGTLCCFFSHWYTCPHPRAQHPRCNALASSALIISLNCILPFSSSVSGDPSRLRSLGHCHRYPPSLGWALNSFNAPRPGVEVEPCGPCLASFPSCCLSFVCTVTCCTEFKVWINCYHLPMRILYDYVQVFLKIQQVWKGGIFTPPWQ